MEDRVDDVGLALLLLSMWLVSWLMLELFSGAAVAAACGAPLLLLSRETASNSWLVSCRFVVCKRVSKEELVVGFMGIRMDKCITGVYFPKI